MKIAIGRGPDFKMSYGKVMIRHLAILEIWDTHALKNRIMLSHMSLVMLCKKIRELKMQNPGIDAKANAQITRNTIYISLESVDVQQELKMTFKFSEDINATQMTNIFDYIRSFFGLSINF